MRRERSVRGFVLVAILWVVLLLSVLATAIATRSVEGRRSVAQFAKAAQLDAAADSAIRLALVVVIANTHVPDRPRPVPTSIDGGDGQVVDVQVERESQRLDLNTADENLLIAYFQSAGWDSESARIFVNRVRDWQDADDSPRPGSMERDGYATLARSAVPRNGPMESVEEVLQVAGGERISKDLLGGLTVYSHSSVPDGATGPEPVQRALRFADEQRLGGHRWLETSAPESLRKDVAGSVLRVRACARRDQARRCREAVIRITGALAEPVQVFLWRTVVSD